MDLILKTNEMASYSLILGNQALIDISRQNYPEAWKSLENALKTAEDNNYYDAMGNAYINAVRLYGEQGQKQKALSWYEKADALIKKKNMNDFVIPLKECSRFL